MTLVYLLILAVVYVFLDFCLRKKLHTKMTKSYWRSFKGRRPLFITIEMVMLASFLVLIFVIPPAYTSVFMFLFFFLTLCNALGTADIFSDNWITLIIISVGMPSDL